MLKLAFENEIEFVGAFAVTTMPHFGRKELKSPTSNAVTAAARRMHAIRPPLLPLFSRGLFSDAVGGGAKAPRSLADLD